VPLLGFGSEAQKKKYLRRMATAKFSARFADRAASRLGRAGFRRAR